MPLLDEAMRNDWGDYVIWDEKKGQTVILTRNEYGSAYKAKGFQAALSGSHTLTLANGATVEVKPVFDLIQQYIMDNFNPEAVASMTWAPVEAITSVARDIADNKGKTLFALGTFKSLVSITKMEILWAPFSYIK